MDWSTFTLPAWAVTEECQAFLYGFGIGFLVRGTRAAIRMLKRVDMHEGDRD